VKLGILGGTFDPIHMAHRAIAEEAMARLKLDEVVFIPAGEPWMKAGSIMASRLHRTNMVRVATEKNPAFWVSDLEIARSGPSFTVDTLERLRDAYGRCVDMFFIVGMDAYSGFNRWKKPDRILELANLAVVSRSDSCYRQKLPSVTRTTKNEGGIVVLTGIDLPISSSDIRRRVAAGLPIRDLVCDEVADYIFKHGLYKAWT